MSEGIRCETLPKRRTTWANYTSYERETQSRSRSEVTYHSRALESYRLRRNHERIGNANSQDFGGSISIAGVGKGVLV